MNATQQGDNLVMRFEALELSLQLIRALTGIVRRIQQHDAEEARQMRTAASSVSRNLAEGRARAGKDRTHLYRIAAGSAEEVRAGLLIAGAWGWVSDDEVGAAMQLVDRLCAILWRLTH